MMLLADEDSWQHLRWRHKQLLKESHAFPDFAAEKLHASAFSEAPLTERERNQLKQLEQRSQCQEECAAFGRDPCTCMSCHRRAEAVTCHLDFGSASGMQCTLRVRCRQNIRKSWYFLQGPEPEQAAVQAARAAAAELAAGPCRAQSRTCARLCCS